MARRRIFIQQLRIDAPVGMLPHELAHRQPLHVDAEFDLEAGPPVADDDIGSVLDYRQLRAALIDECTRAHTCLLETLSERLLERILGEFPQITGMRIRLGKPQAFADCALVGIEISHERTRQCR